MRLIPSPTLPPNCAAVMQVPHIDGESHVYTRVNSWPDHLSKSRPPERVSTNELSSNSTAVQNNQLALIGMLANSYLQEKKGMRRPNMPPHKKGVASRRSGGTINATPSLVDYKYCTVEESFLGAQEMRTRVLWGYSGVDRSDTPSLGKRCLHTKMVMRAPRNHIIHNYRGCCPEWGQHAPQVSTPTLHTSMQACWMCRLQQITNIAANFTVGPRRSANIQFLKTGRSGSLVPVVLSKGCRETPMHDPVRSKQAMIPMPAYKYVYFAWCPALIQCGTNPPPVGSLQPPSAIVSVDSPFSD